MTLYYSPSNKGFYDDEIHSVIPSDAKGITVEQHLQFLEGLNGDMEISVNEVGDLVLVPKPKVDLVEYKAQARAYIDDQRKEEEQNGLLYTFPDEVQDVIQLRDTRDLVNVSSLVTSAQLLVASGFEGTIPFQGESNTTHEMTAEQITTMGLAVSSHIQSLYAKAWPIKVAIDAAEDHDAVDAAKVWPE